MIPSEANIWLDFNPLNFNEDQGPSSPSLNVHNLLRDPSMPTFDVFRIQIQPSVSYENVPLGATLYVHG